MEKQAQLQKQISRALDNFRKLGRKNLSPAIVRCRIRSLKETWLQFLDGHALLEKTVPEATRSSIPYFAEGAFDDIEDIYNGALDQMSVVLEELEPPPSPSHSLDNSFGRSYTPAHTLSHLPPIQIPPFEGDSSEWEPFRDRFTALIIENRDLTDFTRMHFLASFLRGRALECIANLAVTADNFSIAWTALKDRYDSIRRLLSVHLATLTNLPHMSRESGSELQSLRGKAQTTVASLTKLGRTQADLWNDILVFLVTQRLDSVSRKAWNLRTSENNDPPSFEDLDRFLSNRIRALEEFSANSAAKPTSKSAAVPRVHTANASTSARTPCPLCKAAHAFSSCAVFLRGTPRRRRELVKQHRRCFNCLSQNHAAQACQSKYSCRTCNQKHHSLLHVASDDLGVSVAETPASVTTKPSDTTEEVHALSAASDTKRPSPALLATARVTLSSPGGRSIVVRALLDQGSEMTFVTERVAQLLRVKRIRMPVSVSAVGGGNAVSVRYAADVSLAPLHSPSPSFSTTALILRSLTSYAPKQVISSSSLDHLADLPWADPAPLSDEAIDVLIGADLYGAVLRAGLRKGAVYQLFAQNTAFGWIISGPTGRSGSASSSPANASALHSIAALHTTGLSSLEEEIRRFWEIEELPHASLSSAEDEQCEQHFKATHSRSADGRYIVRLPFRKDPPLDIGSSRLRAERVLASINRRLRLHPDHEREYSEFLRDYETLGHMRRAHDSGTADKQIVFIPHHPVVRDHSVTSRLRVVFNASSPTSNGSSLNDHLLAGPKLQAELPAVVLRWRNFRFVYSADVEKMYRQILVDKRDVDYQRILWAESGATPTEFQLLTVTYGTSCAPYLALRVLQQLRHDHGDQFPLADPILQRHVYVDDVLFGGDDLAETIRARDQVVALLRIGGFALRKWSSNSATLLTEIDPANHGLACSKALDSNDSLKILGIAWVPSEDVFRFSVSLITPIPHTKRTMLSAIAKLYDPLGWVTPVTVSAKVLMQQLWREKIDWDAAIPSTLQIRWHNIYQSLSHLNNLRLPRWTGLERDCCSIELHGFADASTVAYAAVIYLKVVSVDRTCVTLLAGRSKVAPLSSLSVPRLELAAAVLLTRLVEFVVTTLDLQSVPCFCWSDSTVVLAWLASDPSRWKVFVANRVADIQRRLPQASWRHVPTEANPADCASRGLLGGELIDHALWWNGPTWLARSAENWPSSPTSPLPESPLEEKCTTHNVVQPNPPWDLLTRFSSWAKLLRITAYILRFISACRRRAAPTPSEQVGSLALTAAECSRARAWLLRRLQAELFPNETRALTLRRELTAKNPILSLRPFMDRDGIIRVGGRLSRAPLPLPVRHPILLSSHRLTEQIIESAHVRALHAGMQLTLNVLRRDFWVLRARSLVRAVIHRCIICVRERAAIPTQIMSDLPKDRVSAPSRAFLHCGLDYAGPVLVRASSGRGITARKAYIALFICLASRAIHLELVSDCSTAAFVNAFSRFCARRGLPHTLYSDNGTTFTGADRELTLAYRSALRDADFQNRTATDGVSWRFIPPSAPHFGGLWEAGVKSVKHHVRRVVQNRTLTFEEFATLLCNVEACVNSRPLAPLSDSLSDYEVLTPGHFLIGSALTAIPEPSLLDVKENRLTRWQLVRQITERFWHLWYSDYVNTLQQRKKWCQVQPSVTIGQLVLLRNATLPPCKWELGRIIECHPGSDGHVRVVTIRTAHSEYKRPLVKLCILPIECDQPSN